MKKLIVGSVLLLLSFSVHAQTRVVESHQGVITIPSDPQRIVALLDHGIMLPLYELGASVVGTVGRQWDGEAPYIRGVRSLYQKDFADLGVSFVGTAFNADLEKIAALNPDLIITYDYGREPLDKLEAIAPTFVIDSAAYSFLERFELLADITNTKERFAALKAHYDDRVAEMREWIETPEAIHVGLAMPRPDNNQITLYRDYGAFSQVTTDIGFALPPYFEAMTGDKPSAKISLEQLGAIDADYLFDTFEPNRGDTADSTVQRYQQMLPQWCDVVEACREGRYIPLRRTDAFSMSFKALDYVLAQLATHIAARHNLYFEE